ncbi:MAG: hypothetical protein ACYC1Z_02625 [Georgenia sp.]
MVPAPDRTVVAVPGGHALEKDLPAVRQAVADWLLRVLPVVYA